MDPENSVCRTCLGSFPVMTDIFSTLTDKALNEIIMECVPIQILSGDLLPSLICALCLQRLNVVRDFRKMCQDSDGSLRKSLSNMFAAKTPDSAYQRNINQPPGGSTMQIKKELIDDIVIKNEPIDDCTVEDNPSETQLNHPEPIGVKRKSTDLSKMFEITNVTTSDIHDLQNIEAIEEIPQLRKSNRPPGNKEKIGLRNIRVENNTSNDFDDFGNMEPIEKKPRLETINREHVIHFQNVGEVKKKFETEYDTSNDHDDMYVQNMQDADKKLSVQNDTIPDIELIEQKPRLEEINLEPENDEVDVEGDSEPLDDDDLKCAKCQAVLTQTLISKHKERCAKNIRDCSFCELKELPLDDFDAHIRKDHFSEFHSCKYCRKIFMEDEHFKKHFCDRTKPRHVDVSTYHCAYCLKLFNNLPEYSSHYRLYHFRMGRQCLCCKLKPNEVSKKTTNTEKSIHVVNDKAKHTGQASGKKIVRKKHAKITDDMSGNSTTSESDISDYEKRDMSIMENNDAASTATRRSLRASTSQKKSYKNLFL